MKPTFQHSLSFWVAFVAVSLLAAGVAVAETDSMMGDDMIEEDDVAQEDEDAYEKMLELSAEGEQLYADGNFAEAADVYQRAWDAYPQPILLKNQMITRYLIEECETAVDLGEKYLATDDVTEHDQQDVETVFGDCSLILTREAVAGQDWMEAEEWLDFGEPYLFDDQMQEDADQLRAQVDEGIAGEEEIEPVEDPGMSTRELAGWSSVGVGAATLLGTGIWHFSWERQVADDAEGVEERYDTVRWAIPTAYVVGATAATVGAGLLLWPMLTGGDEPAAMVQPQIGPDHTGASLSVRF